MAVQIKKAGAYSAAVGVFAKKTGVYSAVQGMFVKVAGVYQSVLGASFPASLFDFTSGLPSGFTLTRGGTDRLARGTNGKWARYAGNTPRIHCSDVGAPLGLVFERAAVDKGRLGFNFASAPTDNSGGFFSTPVNVGMTSAPGTLSQVGFGDIITSALAFTAPVSDNLLQIDTTTGNTNKHTLMGLVRDNQGSGGGTFSALSISGGSTFVPTIYDEWQIIKNENVTPTSAARISQVTCRIGHTFDLAGLWFVEAAYAPLPYWRTADNTQATISDEWATAPLSGITGYSAAGCSIFYEWWHDRPFTVDGEPLIALIDSGASGDYIKIGGRADGTMRIEAFIGGATVFTADFATPARNTNHVAAIRLQAGSWMAAVDGVASAGAAISPSLANINTLNINKHGALASNHFARGLSLAATSLTDAQFIGGSAIQGGFI